MKKILFITNGHGEDQTAAKIIEKLPTDIDVSVMPMVGDGAVVGAFREPSQPINLLGPRKSLPSGGFSARNLLALPKDIISGLLGLLYLQIKTLKKLRGQFDLVVAIGDIVPIFAALITKIPFIFVGVNKSDYYKTFGYNYTPWEKWLLKKYAKIVFARDAHTSNSLKKDGINAVYKGNPLMDGIGSYEIIEKKDGEKIIGFLPGTRKEDIPKNIEDFGKIAKELSKIDKNFRFLVACKSVKAYCNSPQQMQPQSFETLIYNADIIIGLSGTGNEQAAGIGKPVISFLSRGSQYNKKFALAQKELLGDALTLVEPSHKPQLFTPIRKSGFIPGKISNTLREFCSSMNNRGKMAQLWTAIAKETVAILNDAARYNHISEIGKERMDKGGAVNQISQYIQDEVK
ncbi:hypothetical protein A2230_06990 [candidate division WOR-1 bacterium RIFOXYA2_FULL_36_21]|uniref:Uncharacterized protein n=1 Tax=candidate division WOR-1 bacterium RIFOXYB2_FULL_36_35 TaxID=1802578 RepID=A0A1F4S373_UNCSA|nr:MAG: hypothetical protein A2230_06990 [candidate division WOR-1 bacterium RIFOXYA2_FULL_36_21]OGC14827.1 MAG: hypothetical protein A2290_00835 [candidate division WOR-1 bacterium RIFOXYB2_FULL_36_35]OGC15579.1 MAG: hypothetical protein A2282_09080 [candidate division WOR-1 bacterium RIFOXYA12_FULL_36_13]